MSKHFLKNRLRLEDCGEGGRIKQPNDINSRNPTTWPLRPKAIRASAVDNTSLHIQKPVKLSHSVSQLLSTTESTSSDEESSSAGSGNSRQSTDSWNHVPPPPTSQATSLSSSPWPLRLDRLKDLEISRVPTPTTSWPETWSQQAALRAKFIRGGGGGGGQLPDGSDTSEPDRRSRQHPRQPSPPPPSALLPVAWVSPLSFNANHLSAPTILPQLDNSRRSSSGRSSPSSPADVGTSPTKKTRQDNLVPKDSVFTKEEIVETTIDDFNVMLDRYRYPDGTCLTEDKKAEYRDTRRRGKNREAAKKSRHKKMSDLEFLRNQKRLLQTEIERKRKIARSLKMLLDNYQWEKATNSKLRQELGVRNLHCECWRPWVGIYIGKGS